MFSTKFSAIPNKQWQRVPPLQHIHHRTFLFGTKYEQFDKAGKAIHIRGNDFILDEEYQTHFNPRTDVVIRNFSSSVTQKSIEHTLLSSTPLTEQRRFFTNFCGVLEYVPSRFARSYKIGDKVWGVKQHYKQSHETRIHASTSNSFWSMLRRNRSPYAHDNAWSEYVSADIRCIAHLPPQIPLQFGGLFGSDLFMIYDGFGRARWPFFMSRVHGKRVLVVGSGRQSGVNMLLPILKMCGCAHVSVIASHSRHIALLNKFDARAVIDRKVFVPQSHTSKYDIIIDSVSITHEQIQKYARLLDLSKRKPEYWLLRTPFNDILSDANTKMEAIQAMFKWNRANQKALQRANIIGVNLKPIRWHSRQSGMIGFADWLKKLGQHMSDMKVQSGGVDCVYPIIVDRMYRLEDIEHAVNYCMDHDVENEDYSLGEHIGLAMAMDQTNEVLTTDGAIKQWTPMQLLDVSQFEEDRPLPLLNKPVKAKAYPNPS